MAFKSFLRALVSPAISSFVQVTCQLYIHGICMALHHTLYGHLLDLTLTEVFSFFDWLITYSRTFLSHSQNSLSLCYLADGKNFSYLIKVLSLTYRIEKTFLYATYHIGEDFLPCDVTPQKKFFCCVIQQEIYLSCNKL
jgi:hypothetical protein